MFIQETCTIGKHTYNVTYKSNTISDEALDDLLKLIFKMF